MSKINYSKLKPIGDNVLLKVIKQEVSSGGIHLPQERESSQWQPVTCIVLGVGSNKDIECKKNDNVVVNKFAGQSLEQDGVLYKVVSYKDILCVV